MRDDQWISDFVTTRKRVATPILLNFVSMERCHRISVYETHDVRRQPASHLFAGRLYFQRSTLEGVELLRRTLLYN